MNPPKQKNAGDQQKIRSSERLIAELRSQVNKSREDLERPEACMARMWVRWAKVTAARREHLWQVKRDYEMSVATLREINSILNNRVLKQTRDARIDRERCYESIAQMEEQMEMFQDQLIDNTRILGLKNQQIE